jgi:competence protein ComEC
MTVGAGSPAGRAIGSEQRSTVAGEAGLDLRMVPAAAAAWLTAAVMVGRSASAAAVSAVLLSTVAGIVTRSRAAIRATALLCLVVAACSAAVCALRIAANESGPVPTLAGERAYVSFELRVNDDPRAHQGRFGSYVLLRGVLVRVTGRGIVSKVHSPVLVIGGTAWAKVQWGQLVRGAGRLASADGTDLAALVVASGPPRLDRSAGWLYRGADAYRTAIVTSVSQLKPRERALLPALVDGDESAIDTAMSDDFKTTGLTHVLAVSGSNLTLVVSFVLMIGRWAGARGRARLAIAGTAVLGFVVVARPDPSVLRATAMGLVSVVGAAVGGTGVAAAGTAGGSRRGVRALCVAVVGLLLVDPWLARSWGFALSSVATAGIVVFARSWTRRLGRWLPGWLAEAVAVPLAAQLVCTPLIAAISGQVSLVAVLANVLAGPAVGPATVLELLAGAVALMSVTAGHLVAWAAAVPATWIVTVAEHGATLQGASAAWPTDVTGVLALTLACMATLYLVPALLERRRLCVALVAIAAVAVVSPVSAPPPGDWVMAVCDVGQGDALVLNAGKGTAVVVDAGPVPVLVDRCLTRLRVRRVPLLVLTHFHADHVDGLAGVMDGRRVGSIEVSGFREPSTGAALVADMSRRHHVPLSVPTVGEIERVGQVTLRVIGPADRAPPASNNPNDASIVMTADVRGVRILLAGDAQTEEMDDLLRTGTDLRCDVYKVAHHGSANVDPRFVAATHARLAVISVGRDNDYGHPAPTALHELERLHATVHRTDRDGTVLVDEHAGRLAVTTL